MPGASNLRVLTKDKHDFYEENYKTFIKYMKDINNTAITVFMDEKTQCLPPWIYIGNAIWTTTWCFNQATGCFVGTWRAALKIHLEK